MAQEINVVHVMPSIGFGGGAESVLYDLARLIDPRFRMTVLYWNQPDDMVPALRKVSCGVEHLSLSKVVSLRSVREIARSLKNLKADLVHTHFMDADLLGVLASRLARVPMVSHIHSFPFPSTRRHAVRYRMMSSAIRKYICVSDYARQFFVSSTKVSLDKVAVIHNGIERARFAGELSAQKKAALRKGLGIGMDDVVIGNVSRLVPYKGQDVFLKAALMVLTRRTDVRFLIVGDGEERQGLERLAVSLGIRDHVVFAGTRQDVPDLLKMMDIFVFPPAMESFGLCLIEAMAAGKPVIAAQDCAMPEVIQDGVDGLLFTSGDERSLAHALFKILGDRQTEGALATQALRRSEMFSSQIMVRKIETLYDGVLRRA